MRTPPNLKFLLIFLFAIAAITAGVIWLPSFIPGLGYIIGGIVVIGMCGLIFITLLKPFVTFLYARADGIFAVYSDITESGLLIFCYHLNSGGEFSSGTRDILLYFVRFSDGKRFLKNIFSHSMEAADGYSGWGTFRSFEQSVLGSEALNSTLLKLSKRTGINLKPGVKWPGDNDEWKILLPEKTITIKKFKNVADEGVEIGCVGNGTGEKIWRKRI